MKKEKESATQRRLKRAALECIASQGFEGASVNEIVVKAGVSKPVLYYYYRNKEDIYLAILADSLADFGQRLEKVAGEDLPPMEKLVTAVKYCFAYIEDSPEKGFLILDYWARSGYRPMHEETAGGFERIRLLIEAIIREGIKAGDYRPGDPIRYARHLLGMIHSQIMFIYRFPDSAPYANVEEFVDLFLRGLRSDPA